MNARYPHIWSGVEELASLPQEVKDQAVRQCMRDRFFTFAMISLACLAAAGATLVLLKSAIPVMLADARRLLNLHPASVVAEDAMIIVGVGISWALLGRIVILLTHAVLRSDLRRIVHVAACTGCGYNLSGLLLSDPLACCPECATPLPNSIVRQAELEGSDPSSRLPVAWGRKRVTQTPTSSSKGAAE